MLATTILKAIQNNDIRFFETNTIDVATVSEEGNPWLYVAAQYDRLDIIKQLLHQQADVNATNYQGFTALHVAASNNHLDVSKILLKHGARIEAKSGKKGTGWTPLHVAATKGWAEMIRLLLEHKAAINAKNKKHITPLIKAAQEGHIAATQALLESSAPVDEKDNENNTALIYAIFAGHTEVVDLLLTHGANPHIKISHQGSNYDLVNVAVIKSHYSLVELLFERKLLQVNKKDSSGRTILFYTEDLRIVDLLLNYGANINAQDYEGNTSLHELAVSGSSKCLESFLKRGASVYIKNKENQTPLASLLSHAIHLENRSKVLALLNYGSDVEDLEYVEAGLGFAFWDTLDSVRVDLSPKVIDVFFEQAETLPDAMAQYEVFIRFLLLGFVIESNNTEAIKDIVRYIKENNPEANFEIDQHPVVKAWGHITTTVTTLLEAKNIEYTEEEIPEILYFMFSVYKRWPNKPYDEKNSAEYILTQSSKMALTDKEDEKLQTSNPLYYLSRNKMDSSHVIHQIAENILDEEMKKYTKHSALSVPVLRRLCLELADPSSSFTTLLEKGLNHSWVEGPLLSEAQLNVTPLSIKP